MAVSLSFGCGAKGGEKNREARLPDGVYTAEFQTDSGMFHVNEACEGKGTLTVEQGEMTIHISLGSKKIVNLYPGLAEEAEKDGAELLSPTEDTVTYSDGMTEEVYGFDVPVPALDTEFDLALIGTKGKWYDHKVSVSNPAPKEEDSKSETPVSLKDGVYSMDITFEGGTGKARILSPVKVTVTEGKATAAVQWNSPNYDYMIVEGEKYLPVNTEGNSDFEIPVPVFDEPMEVVGDTVAMSKPHEVDYTITFHSETAKPEEEIPGLIYEKSMELSYAQNFSVDYYKGGYTMLSVMDGRKILVVPEDKEVPQGLGEDIYIMKRPVQNLYLVASAVMDMFDAIDGADLIRLSGQKQENWYIESARNAMAQGNMIYAGKYNKPDYELIVSENCSLAIENRMVFHSPEVIEMLEKLGIPVMVEYSGYEPHPLGRVEWVKFFGALAGKEEEAERVFARQEAILKKVTAEEKTDKTVAFFYIASNGQVQVRQSADYIPKMIALAGGRYIFQNLGDSQSKRSTVSMQAEEFYSRGKDADFLIYNSSIDGGVVSVEALLDKCRPLEDFKAVKEGNVFCTENDMYQQSMSIGDLMNDIHEMLMGRGDGEMKYLFQLE